MDSGNTKMQDTCLTQLKINNYKDSAGSDYNQRVAPGHNEIVP